MHTILKVSPIAGETGRYMVEGRSLACNRPGCNYAYTPPKDGKPPTHAENDACPRHGCTGVLRPCEYLCDLQMYNGNGKCGCWRWQFQIQPQLNKMPPSGRLIAREGDDLRCAHLIAAMRYFALEFLDRLQSKDDE
jgi:hypothetical protein